jgi:hypothetical protein
MDNSLHIEEMLEKIVFDKTNLVELKDGLMKLKTGELSIDRFGKKILELRGHILQRLIEFFPFHLKQAHTTKTLSEYTENGQNTSQLKKDLEKKDHLLETIGTRIHKLYEKLSSDLESSS